MSVHGDYYQHGLGFLTSKIGGHIDPDVSSLTHSFDASGNQCLTKPESLHA